MPKPKKRKFKIYRDEVIKCVALGLAVALLILTGGFIGFSARPASEPTEPEAEPVLSIEFADEQIPTILETEDGEIETIEAPTVEFVDSDTVTDGEEHGKGSYAPTSTPQEFYDYVVGKCFNEDGWFGAQCWDLAQLFWINYAGRVFSTCGTGAAKGAWLCKETNAGEDFELITDTHSLQAGDWVIFSNGIYGHVGMALGNYNNGYIALLGQNQGGKSCNGGGSSANVINISLTGFVGAFRPKTYITPDPEPEPTPETDDLIPCKQVAVKKGDTLGDVMKRCEGEIDWSKMKEYAKHWYSIKDKTYETVYDGWVSTGGYGFFADDIIEYRD